MRGRSLTHIPRQKEVCLFVLHEPRCEPGDRAAQSLSRAAGQGGGGGGGAAVSVASASAVAAAGGVRLGHNSGAGLGLGCSASRRGSAASTGRQLRRRLKNSGQGTIASCVCPPSCRSAIWVDQVIIFDYFH
eukprot:SAG25_NODE_85_length_16527_cov_73.409240_9_plen_132_part_00